MATCEPGKIQRVGYTTKRGTRVAPTCVVDRGAPGKTPDSKKILPQPKKGELAKYGYNTFESDQQRFASLKRAAADLGALSTRRHLQLIRNRTAKDEKSKHVLEVYDKDLAYLKSLDKQKGGAVNSLLEEQIFNYGGHNYRLIITDLVYQTGSLSNYNPADQIDGACSLHIDNSSKPSAVIYYRVYTNRLQIVSMSSDSVKYLQLAFEFLSEYALQIGLPSIDIAVHVCELGSSLPNTLNFLYSNDFIMVNDNNNHLYLLSLDLRFYKNNRY